MMLSGKLPMIGIVSDGSAAVLNRAPAPAATGTGTGFGDEYPS